MLARYPQDAAKVFQELHEIDIKDPGKLATLLHMNGLINEAMRLYPAAMTGGSRITPPEGLQVDEAWIPGGVKVAAPKYSIFRCQFLQPSQSEIVLLKIHPVPTAFVRPLEMIPERWYSRPELVLDRTAFAPFGAGIALIQPRGCKCTG